MHAPGFETLPPIEDLEIRCKLPSTKNSLLYLASLNGNIEKPVVCKMPANTPRGLASFTNELRELPAAQDIEGVIPLLGFGKGKKGSKSFLITPYIPGGSLEDIPPPANSDHVLADWQVFRGIASVLVKLHEREIVHRDIKPGNILRDEDNSIYLIDFGDASHRFRRPDGVKRGNVRGTLSHLSPERLMGNSTYLESDAYSFGVSIIETLTGKHPWLDHGESATSAGSVRLFRRISNEQPKIEADKLALVPPEVIEFALGCLDPRPENRPPIAKALELN